jgi:biotin carboxylase
MFSTMPRWCADVARSDRIGHHEDVATPRKVAVLHGPGASVSVREILRACGTDVRPTFVVDSGGAEFVAMVSRVADTKLVDENDWVRAVADVAPDAVVTFDDRLVDTIEDVCHRLELRGGSALADPWDKLVQREQLNTAGASSVRVRRVTTWDDVRAARTDVGRAGILKPRRSSSGRGIRIVAPGDSTEDVWSDVAAHSAAVHYLYEELMDAEGGDGWLAPFVSVDTASIGRDRRHFGMFDKLPLARGYLETGHIGPSGMPPGRVREILDVVEAALDVLGVSDRVTHTEVRLTSVGPQVIEVNGRLGGYVHGLCASLVGLDATRMALELACGAKPEIPSLDDLGNADHAVVAIQLPLLTASADAARRITRRMRSYPFVRAVPVSAEFRYAGAWVEAASRRELFAAVAAMVADICANPADRGLIEPRWRDIVTNPPSGY